MDPDELLAESDVTVRAGRYAIVKSRRSCPDAFATIDDDTETTVVVKSGGYDPDDAIEVEDGWRLLTFELVLPFELVGFLARVATELASVGVSIFAISAYSTDHVLVSADDLEAAVDCLEGLGCTVTIQNER